MGELDEGRFRYRAFISYSHRDKVWCDWLHRTLETYRVPSRLVGQLTGVGPVPKRLMPIFRDRDELPSAADLNGKVREALEASACLIVVCSPAAATSRWVNEEVRSFMRSGRADRIFCLIVDGEPNASQQPGREAEECFPPSLRFRSGADGVGIEPIAADARATGDGKLRAKLKLIAGLLDVRYDLLRRREQQRRNRRLLAVAAFSIAGLMLTSALALEAFVARNAAERRQAQAEALVGFMLGDLNDKLRQVGRLDILQSVADQSMGYFASLPSADITDSALGLRAKALQKIGGIRMDQNDLAGAIPAFEAAVSLTREVARRHPKDIDAQDAYAANLNYLGKNRWLLGDLDGALAQFQAVSDILIFLTVQAPKRSDLQDELATSRTNLGHVLELQNKFDGAQREYQAVLVIYQTLTETEPSTAEWQSELGFANNNLGKLALERGHLNEALRYYRTDQDIKAALSAKDPTNTFTRENLLLADAILGRTLIMSGRLDSAYKYLDTAVRIADQLVSVDSTQTDWKSAAANYRLPLARVVRAAGDLDRTRLLVDTSTAIFEGLHQQDKKNPTWQSKLALAELERARLQWTQKRSVDASASAATALSTVTALLVNDTKDPTSLLCAARAELLLAQMARAAGNTADAQQFSTSALDHLRSPALNTDEPETMATLAQALLQIGRPVEAKPLLERLQSMGFAEPDFTAFLSTAGINYRAVATANAVIAAAPVSRSTTVSSPPQRGINTKE